MRTFEQIPKTVNKRLMACLATTAKGEPCRRSPMQWVNGMAYCNPHAKVFEP